MTQTQIIVNSHFSDFIPITNLLIFNDCFQWCSNIVTLSSVRCEVWGVRCLPWDVFNIFSFPILFAALPCPALPCPPDPACLLIPRDVELCVSCWHFSSQPDSGHILVTFVIYIPLLPTLPCEIMLPETYPMLGLPQCYVPLGLSGLNLVFW